MAFSTPYSGAYSWSAGRRVAIFDAKFVRRSNGTHPFFAGLVLRADKDKFSIACRDGVLLVPKDAVVGDTTLRVGQRLWSPSAAIDAARELRPIYTPSGLRDAVNADQKTRSESDK